MWQVAVVDDQASIRRQMGSYFQEYSSQSGEQFHITYFENPLLLLDKYKPRFDLILMDIDMPIMSGMEAARQLRRLDEQVVLIFITNLAQYAIDGYEVQAVDYCLKPLEYSRFAVKLTRALRFVPPRDAPVIFLKSDLDTVSVKQGDITYVDVEGHYLTYHTARKAYRVRGTLKEAQSELMPPDFFLCNKCYLVNLRYVEKISGYDVLVAGEEITVSRPRKKDFLEALAAYHGKI